MRYTVLGKKAVSFTAADGKVINGTTLYAYYYDESANVDGAITDKIFVIIRCLCENKKIEFKDCFRGNKYKLYYEMYKKWLDDD